MGKEKTRRIVMNENEIDNKVEYFYYCQKEPEYIKSDELKKCRTELQRLRGLISQLCVAAPCYERTPYIYQIEDTGFTSPCLLLIC